MKCTSRHQLKGTQRKTIIPHLADGIFLYHVVTSFDNGRPLSPDIRKNTHKTIIFVSLITYKTKKDLKQPTFVLVNRCQRSQNHKD